MSHTPPIYKLAIQPPSIAPRSGPLFPPPTLLFLFSAQNSPFSLIANNLLAIVSLVPASIDSDDLTGLTGDYLTGTLAVPATPLSDGSGVAFVFRNLSVERVGHWRIKITVLRTNEEREGDEGAVVGIEVISAVVGVEEGAERSEELSLIDQDLLDSLGE